MTRATVLLADDHPVTAALLRQLLWATFDVVGEVSDGSALVEAAGRLKPDVIVTDISMPGLDGIEATRRILAMDATARIVFVTVHSEPAVVERALAAGARAYVVKSIAADELVPAIRSALRGDAPFTRLADDEHTIAP